MVLPEGLYDTLGFNKQGVSVITKSDGSRYVEIVTKDNYTFPHKLNPNVLIEENKFYRHTRLEGTPNITTNPTSGNITVKEASTAVALPKNAYITCSLLAHQHVGDRELPLLEVVSLPFAARGAGDQAKEHVYEPKHVKYHPLAHPKLSDCSVHRVRRRGARASSHSRSRRYHH